MNSAFIHKIIHKIRTFCIQYSTSLLLLTIILPGLYLRLHHLHRQNLDPDELQWQKRGRYMLRKLSEHDWIGATAPLRHPGIIPALLNGTAFFLLSTDQMPVLIPFKKVDPIIACRLPFTIIGTLTGVFMFLWGKKLVPPLAAYTAAFLIACDPHSIALSRKIHLDATLTFFIILSLLAFLIAEKHHSIRWKIFSSLLLGCALLTKITGLLLIPALLSVHFLYCALLQRKQHTLHALFMTLLYDILWACGGILIYLTFFTALWKKIDSATPWIQAHTPLFTLLTTVYAFLDKIPFCSIIMISLIIHLVLWRIGHQQLNHDYATAAWIKRINLAILTITIFVFVIKIYKNPLLHYLFQLKKDEGLLLKRKLSEYKYYFGTISTRAPWFHYPLFSLVSISEGFILLWIAGMSTILARMWRTAQTTLSDWVFICYPVIMMTILSFSAIKAGRYINSIVPCYAFIAGIGCSALWIWIQTYHQHVRGFFVPLKIKRLGALLCLFCLFAYSFHTAHAINPEYILYYNVLAGGPAGMDTLNTITGPAGHREVIKYLKKVVKPYDNILAYGVYKSVLSYYWYDLKPSIPCVTINGKFRFSDADYLVVFRKAEQVMQNKKMISFLQNTTPLHTVRIQGINAAKIYCLKKGNKGT